jgi:probable rRNA maturation factor
MTDIEVLGRLPSGLTRRGVLRAVESAIKASRKKPEGAFTVAFVGEAAMRKLNRESRKLDQSTDVLSFALADFKVAGRKLPLRAGDVYVCPAFVKRDAKASGQEYRNQLMRVIIHGVLHLLGFDHAKPVEARRMFGLQEKVLADQL